MAETWHDLRIGRSPDELREILVNARVSDGIIALERLANVLLSAPARRYATQCACFYNGFLTNVPPIPDGMDPEDAILIKEIVRQS